MPGVHTTIIGHCLSVLCAGKMRCLAALAQWENLSELCRKAWAEPSAQKQIAPLVCVVVVCPL